MSLAWAEFLSFWSNWTLIGALIVGVLATYGIAVSGDVKETALKREVANAGIVAETAKENAAKASERAANLEIEAERAKEKTAEIEKDAAIARAAIAAANARAAEANQIAENERLERLKLEARLAPRIFSEQSRHEMASVLKKFAGTAVDVFAYAEGSSADTAPFAQSLMQMFEEAGWTPRYWTAIGGAGVLTGVLVVTREGSDKQIEDSADAIVIGLRIWQISAARWDQHFKTSEAKEIPGTAGINGPNWDQTNVAPIRLLIGTKPQ